MGVQKLQANRALRIIPSNDALIQFPSQIEAGINTAIAANQLIDTVTGSFVDLNVRQVISYIMLPMALLLLLLVFSQILRLH